MPTFIDYHYRLLRSHDPKPGHLTAGRMTFVKMADISLPVNSSKRMTFAKISDMLLPVNSSNLKNERELRVMHSNFEWSFIIRKLPYIGVFYKTFFVRFLYSVYYGRVSKHSSFDRLPTAIFVSPRYLSALRQLYCSFARLAPARSLFFCVLCMLHCSVSQSVCMLAFTVPS